ncbi:hypothetical protein G8759_12885 [Spirosoma aureum]|uniref:Uncharacterized protein n=1 Tax=Spirosoma aureum TaxID=2692134 RepID=A0A6G9AM96_9BACT|nr:hypothetical protein [Spirosoma aureum]QIP13459.1 hypothetical protein G8759_12885 [Spirosoma aureum]
MINSKVRKTVSEFDGLPFAEQAAIIWQKGQPVATRHLPDFRLHLYAVDHFFVEMWVCRRRFIVTLFRPITDTDDLLPYVNLGLPVQNSMC